MADELDCLTCGACCRTGGDGRILIPPEDLARWLHNFADAKLGGG